ncbi:MAG: [FeFe] hydrogenase H-cluster maturation GTPase HydF [Planctomycetes bacterium GWF2_41_51]|nr:MAG: [FeFe] hydrogenase H-cluster maturation GTPase HydF [Planctomycetes bacterium GWF2_41_51]HBG25533.1 [FeFe] hydrogenase H-cluster maturation GTPase HydF [Phycisphaerales bacterium]
MTSAPKSLRLHIGIFGRRNVGKSSLLNAITRQQVSIVSDIAGTTTDPVEKPMEFLPIGPVLFIDTAGVDDIGALGELRIKKTKQIFDRTELGVIVSDNGQWGNFENGIYQELTARKTPVIAVFNKCDIAPAPQNTKTQLKANGIPYVETSVIHNKGILELREALIRSAPESFINYSTIMGDLVVPGELAVLVVPIDKEAPKGRLIVPQVQCIRDLLDNDSYCIVVKERELNDALKRLENNPPKIVVTDSQAFLKVAADTPNEILMTSFSILFARFKGDLNEFVNGAAAIKNLKSGDKVLIAESCSHHPIAEDIGRVKIPRWMAQYVGGELKFDVYQGNDFPENLAEYKLVLQCGGCMTNRRQVLSRIEHCRKLGVPITNYGVAIAYILGIFERALRPFAGGLDYFRKGEV